MDKLIITESIHGNWFYHLSIPGKFTKGLCGKDTMLTCLPISFWGTEGHLNERYCKRCEAMVNFIADTSLGGE